MKKKWSHQQITQAPTGSIHEIARKKFDPKKINGGLAFEEKKLAYQDWKGKSKCLSSQVVSEF